MIITYTGKHMDPLDPKTQDLDIEDIAHALSLICRGNGQVRKFYSVAQHCIACAAEAEARGCSDRIVLACLLHDAAECYLSDVPRPVKSHLEGYSQMEERIMDKVWEAFLDGPLSEEEKACVQAVDDDLLWYDLSYLLEMPDGTQAPEMKIPVTQKSYRLRSFGEVEDDFLEMFWMYRGETGPVIILEDMAEAFDEVSDSWMSFVNLKTGKVVSLPDQDMLLGAVSQFEDLRREIEETDDYRRLPGRAELDERRIMAEFAALQEENAREQLQEALYTRHPARRFKETAMRMGCINAYYSFRKTVFLRKAEEFCEENGLRFRHRRKNEKRLFG